MICLLLLLLASVLSATEMQITHKPVTTADGNQGIEVEATLTEESGAAAYVIRLIFQTESGRPMWYSKLIEFRDRYKQGANVVAATFDTGPGKVRAITVEELKAVSFKYVEY